MIKKNLDSKGRIQKTCGTLRERKMNVADFFLGEVITVDGLKFVVTETNRKKQELKLKLQTD